jgi:hypothetical protein
VCALIVSNAWKSVTQLDRHGNRPVLVEGSADRLSFGFRVLAAGSSFILPSG